MFDVVETVGVELVAALNKVFNFFELILHVVLHFSGFICYPLSFGIVSIDEFVPNIPLLNFLGNSFQVIGNLS